MLIESLRLCFAAKSEFSKYSLPLLLEKINSSNEDAQIDAMDTYSLCSKVYDVKCYKEYIDQLWISLQKITMNTNKSLQEEASLKAIESLACAISQCVQNFNLSKTDEIIKNELSINFFIEKAIQNCVGYLNEPDLKLGKLLK